MSFVRKEHILSFVNILDVARDFDIRLEPVSSGNFDYRCKCPSPEHKHGSERTSSCYIDSVKNNFYCFGCSSNHNVIDFHILCTGNTFGESFSELSKRIDLSKLDSISSPAPRKNNFKTLLEISNVIRKHIINSQDDIESLDLFMKKVDGYLDLIGTDSPRKAKALLNRISCHLNKKVGR